jgi:hypothetical protein
VNGKGIVSEVEVSATSDGVLSQAAVDLVKGAVYPAGQVRELYVNVRFVPAS